MFAKVNPFSLSKYCDIEFDNRILQHLRLVLPVRSDHVIIAQPAAVSTLLNTSKNPASENKQTGDVIQTVRL